MGMIPCGGGIPTLPNLPNPEDYPCDQLKKMKDKPGFQNKMTVLKNNIPSGTEEKGFTINSIPNQEISPVVQGGGAKGGVKYPLETMPLEQLYKTYGTAHNHLENNPEHIGIFTPEDIGNLFYMGSIETSSQNPYRIYIPQNAVIFVITNRGLFALKINDFSKLSAYATWWSDMVISDVKYKTTKTNDYVNNEFSSSKKYNITPTATHDETVTGFLRFIKDKDIGVDLYEGDKDTYGNWKKLTLNTNPDGTFTYNEEPCAL